MHEIACMVITAWNDLYPGDLPLLEISSSKIDRSARHSRLAGTSASCLAILHFIKAPACYNISLIDKKRNPTYTHPRSQYCEKDLPSGFGYSLSIHAEADYSQPQHGSSLTVLSFPATLYTLAYFYYSLPEFVPTSVSQ
jgi:hypothetical protein